ncbi:MAG TPA: nuclear transport factor 2 family protein [Dehalococcoidia bacterium]|nr:nuclear transport factor 2 family protein [Dehalococcoidia bacterium]
MGAKTPGELSLLFAKYVGEGDLDALVALYEPAAAFHDQAGTVHNGAEAIRAAMKPFAEMKPDITCDPRKVVQTGDIAMVHNYWKMTGAAGHAVEVARRQPDGSWLYVIDDPFGDRQA